MEVRFDKELLLNPLLISRNEQEKILIEGSINAVRVSVKIKQSDAMDIMLADRFSRFLMQRAEDFEILRRKAVPVKSPLSPLPLSLSLISFHCVSFFSLPLLPYPSTLLPPFLFFVALLFGYFFASYSSQVSLFFPCPANNCT